MLDSDKHRQMQADIDKVLRNLGVVAALKQNDKLSTEGEFFTIYVPTAMRSVMRMLYRESREQNLVRCADCIRNAKTFVANTISEHGASSDTVPNNTSGTVQMRLHRHMQVQLCARVLNALSEATAGLDNLTQTYADDAAMLVQLRQLKSEVTDFLESTQTLAKLSPVVARLQ